MLEHLCSIAWTVEVVQLTMAAAIPNLQRVGVSCASSTLASYTCNSASEAVAMVAQAEERKKTKYQNLDASLSFIPVAAESTEVFCV